MKIKSLYLNLAASTLVIGVGIFGVKYLLTNAPQAEKQKPTANGLMVETTLLKPSNHALVIPSIGTVEPSQKATLSAKVSGKLVYTSPALVPGGVFKKGELLAQIDTSDYEAALAQIDAQLRSAKATEQIELGQQASAKKELELSGLNPSGLSRSLMLREPQLAQVQSSIASLEASLKSAQNNLKETRIVAPYDGVVTKKSAELGNYISAQSSVAEFVATQTFWLYATIPASYLPLLPASSSKELASLHVTLFSHSKPLKTKARILKILPELDTTTKQARLLISIDEPLGKELSSQEILLGDTLHVEIKAGMLSDTFALPLQFLRANSTVWIMDSAQKLSIRPVEIAYKNEQFAFIRKGLSAEDKIITSYLTTAVEGMALIDASSLKKAKKGE